MEPIIMQVKNTMDVKVMYLLLKYSFSLKRSGSIILDLGMNLLIVSNVFSMQN
jgi:hypothetical protein